MNICLEKSLKQAKAACRIMKSMDTKRKNQALQRIAEGLLSRQDEIITANRSDMQAAEDHQMPSAMLDRLMLDEERIHKMAEDVRKLIRLEDPIGQVIMEMTRPNGLKIEQVRVPIGVFGIIYEARPNVTVDIASLCIKSGNVCVLKGGKEAYHTNVTLAHIMREAITPLLPEDVICLVEQLDRSVVEALIMRISMWMSSSPEGERGLSTMW